MAASWIREKERKREGEKERDRQASDPVHFEQGELAEKLAKGT